jgi:hypothetical protein
VKKLLLASLILLATSSCSPAAKTIADTIVNVAVDACQEAKAIAPGDTTVSLVCAVVDGGAPIAHVVIDSNVWNQMKVQYKKEHGKLPEGVSEPK